MMTWRPIETAPKDRHLLLFGGQKPPFRGVTYYDPLVFSGYWDSIDQAWCAHGSTAEGPFFHATHWQPLPAVPEFAAVEIPKRASR
jgi:hypothetical protein